MNIVKRRAAVLFVMLLFHVGCTSPESPWDGGIFEGRWYTESDMNSGREVFIKNCAKCHKREAQGVPDWKNKNPDGSYPAPPLNGTAHAWHHSRANLLETIDKGGISSGGKMPAFKGRLTLKEKLSTVAYFQSFWPDRTYREWLKRNQGN